MTRGPTNSDEPKEAASIPINSDRDFGGVSAIPTQAARMPTIRPPVSAEDGEILRPGVRYWAFAAALMAS